MNNINFQTQRHISTKHNPNKKRLTQDQVRRLEISFSSNSRLEPSQKLQLARELAIPPKQVAIWYQNRRAKCKTQSLELDYGTLRLRLEATLAENMRLEKEVERLEGELKESREFFLANMKMTPHHHHHHHDYGNNIGSSSSEQDVSLSTCSWVENENFELEELYSCLIYPPNRVS